MQEAKNPIVILGSGRSDGNTLQAVQTVIKDQTTPIIDLRKFNISHYDYNYENKHDDFIPLAEQMVEHSSIILATPVYWYTMSALMKMFIDRWSDLIDLRKDLGRKLAHKELYVITSYAGEMPRGFEDPFSQTCSYLDMHYRGCFYFYSGTNLERCHANGALAEQFSNHIYS